MPQLNLIVRTPYEIHVRGDRAFVIGTTGLPYAYDRLAASATAMHLNCSGHGLQRLRPNLRAYSVSMILRMYLFAKVAFELKLSVMYFFYSSMILRMILLNNNNTTAVSSLC